MSGSLVLALWLVVVVVVVASAGGVCSTGCPQQGGAEESYDGQVENHSDRDGSNGAQEGGHGSVGGQPASPGAHISQDSLHLEVGPHHSADMEELVTVTDVVESAWSQPLR